MSRVEKEKNIIKFFIGECEKPVTFDVNTGILYGVSGRQLHSTPSGLIKVVTTCTDFNSVYVIHYAHSRNSQKICDMAHNKYIELFALADKLQSVNVKFKNYWDIDTLEHLIETKFLEENFKDFAKWFKEEKPNYNDFSNLISLYNTSYAQRVFAKELKFEDEHFTPVMKDYLFNYYMGYGDTDKVKPYLPRLAYYLSKGVWDFFCENDNGRYGSGNGRNQLNAKFDEFIDICDSLEVEMPKGDFFRNFIDLKRTYLANRYKIDNAKIKKYQTSKNLEFELDNLVVVVPTSTEEIQAEGLAQNNCVANYYLPKVVKGETHIVFVRHKDNIDKSYITCEITNDGRIRQYLCAMNSRPTLDEDKNFEKAYQIYLTCIWGK